MTSVEVAMIQEYMPGAVCFASDVITGIPNSVSAIAMLVLGYIADIVGVPWSLPSLLFVLAAAFILCIVILYPLRMLHRKCA